MMASDVVNLLAAAVKYEINRLMVIAFDRLGRGL